MRATILAVCAALASPALLAAPERPAGTLQQQLDALVARVAALEANDRRLREQAEAANAAAKAAQDELVALRASVAAAAPVAEAAPAAASGGNANAFNPAISVVLNGSYSSHSKNPDDYVRAGFPAVGEGGPSPRGFSLGESELSFAANIDEKFYGQLTFTAESEHGEDHVGVEEAFVDTTALPEGFNLRLGRFYSDIGYLNSHHAHTDSFFDRPLPYQAFLGNQFGDDGVQLRWLAPTDLYLELGGEIFRGENFPAAGAAHGGAGARTLFAHAGGDVGMENSWLAGVSMLKSTADGAEDGFGGDSTLYIADATWKWAPQGNFKDGGVTVRGEYFSDHRDGVVATPGDDGSPLAWRGARRGAYLEAVYRFNRTWDLGYRVDKLWADRQGPFASAFDPYRNTLELAWHNSEFSLLRLQFSRDEPDADTTDNALTLQYQVSLGAHGAHKF
ncbi:MAG TPA: hypothetical protein VFS55_13260 [Dokdonella sp.]|nr:hypothetical protein [Dokdonella sp.]